MCNFEEAEAQLSAMLAELDHYAPDLTAWHEEAEASLAALLADLDKKSGLELLRAELLDASAVCPCCGRPYDRRPRSRATKRALKRSRA